MRLTVISITLFVAGLLMFSACKSKKEMPKEELATVKGDKWATAKSGPCFGRCPVYELTIFEGGFAEVKAVKYLDIEGWHQKKLDINTYRSLQDAFAKADFNALQDNYVSYIADLPSKTVGLYTDGILKTVTGKETLPQSVHDILKLMDQIVISEGWEVFTPAPEKELPKPEEPSYIYEEILIEPMPDVKLPVWFQSKKDLGIYLKRRVHPNMNVWVVGYSQDRYAPKEMLAMLQKDPEIKSAEFNIRVKGR